MKFQFTKYKHTHQLFYSSLEHPATVTVFNDYISVTVIPFLVYCDKYYILNTTTNKVLNVMKFVVSRGSFDSGDIYNIEMGGGKFRLYSEDRSGIFLK